MYNHEYFFGSNRTEEMLLERRFDPGTIMNIDLCEFLGSDHRDFLIRNNGDQVKISSLKGNKMVGIYICRPGSRCTNFVTPLLLQLHSELSDSDFEIVMVWLGSQADEDESFHASFAQMPWLAVPHDDSNSITNGLNAMIGLSDELNFGVIDKTGEILNRWTDKIVRCFGSEAYPFTRERLLFLINRETERKRNQTITSLLGDEFEHLVGKTVALYFQPYDLYEEFSEILAWVYTQLKEKGEEFEVVLVPNRTSEDFDRVIKTMPWLPLPKLGKRTQKLWFNFDFIPAGQSPHVQIIGPDGRDLELNGSVFIRQHGTDAFPFTRQNFDELERKVKQDPWTLETLLDSHGRDFVVRKDGSKVPVRELVGKTVMLYSWETIGQKKFMESGRGINVGSGP